MASLTDDEVKEIQKTIFELIQAGDLEPASNLCKRLELTDDPTASLFQQLADDLALVVVLMLNRPLFNQAHVCIKLSPDLF